MSHTPKTRRYGGERQVRLKPQHADRYQGILPGEWVPAPVMVERLLRLAEAARVPPHERVCDPNHFEFRGGVGRGVELRDLRTRRSDRAPGAAQPPGSPTEPLTSDPNLFPGFETSVVDVGETTVFIRRKGNGRPLLLLHGFPQTHLMWHRVAAALAEEFTVVCADLRGYGASGKPPSRPDHSAYSKSAMALDLVRLMEVQGFDRFSVAGHDRGARVAYRMALDHGERVARLGVLDVIPTSEALHRADTRFALAYWPWSLLAQPEPLPERMILADPDIVVNDALANWGSDKGSFPPMVRAAYVKALRDPDSVHAICEEYRAAATIDLARETEDRLVNRKIRCPVLVLWGKGGPLDSWYGEAGGPLGIWSEWALEVTGHPIAGGHFFPEQNPAETVAELRSHFGPSDRRSHSVP